MTKLVDMISVVVPRWVLHSAVQFDVRMDTLLRARSLVSDVVELSEVALKTLQWLSGDAAAVLGLGTRKELFIKVPCHVLSRSLVQCM